MPDKKKKSHSDDYSTLLTVLYGGVGCGVVILAAVAALFWWEFLRPVDQTAVMAAEPAAQTEPLQAPQEIPEALDSVTPELPAAQPETLSVSAPEPEPEPEPEPAPEPTPAPEPEPAPEPVPAAAPVSTPEPAPVVLAVEPEPSVIDLPAEPTPLASLPQEQPDEDWRLRLVNPWNYIPEDFEVTLKSIGNGHKVDERCYDDLQAMLEACKAAGCSPVVTSSYRTQAKQESLYANKIQRLMNQGYSKAEATAKAGTVVAVPGTSEHQLGLALDIVDASYQVLDQAQESTHAQKWLMEHSWEYGFILRYPSDKTDITGIIYEPWHYRYVGPEAAEEIYTQGVCLEEYLGRVHEET